MLYDVGDSFILSRRRCRGETLDRTLQYIISERKRERLQEREREREREKKKEKDRERSQEKERNRDRLKEYAGKWM